MTRTRIYGAATVLFMAVAWGSCAAQRGDDSTGAANEEPALEEPALEEPPEEERDAFLAGARAMLEEGREIFRFDTFGSEQFWGGALRLHEAIGGEDGRGGAGGLSAEDALALGLKVDVAALPQELRDALAAEEVDLTSAATTLALLELDAVIGVKGFFADAAEGETRALTGVGIQCSLCHSTVDDSFAPGIGQRRDGWPNRDLDIGAIVATAPNLQPIADLLSVDVATVRTVLTSWGPGRYDAQLLLDGKAFRPDGATGATLLPAAFGLAGIDLHTYTGWGSVPYWNAFVATTQMHGMGTFYDPRLDNAEQFPVAAEAGFANQRVQDDQLTAKLPALHLYQIALPAPEPPAGSYDAEAAARGEGLFTGKADCARCHVPPLYTEPGRNLHLPEEIGIDDFQASRSPTGRYRTTPLGGLFTRMQGGFYHDGRFATLADVVTHYDSFFELGLSDAEQTDLVEYLKSL